MDAVREDIIKLVHKELESANEKFPPFNSGHEGYGVIKEEIEEAKEAMIWCDNQLEYVWYLIKMNDIEALQEVDCLRKFAIDGAIELIQVAAMAQKFIDSLGGSENE